MTIERNVKEDLRAGKSLNVAWSTLDMTEADLGETVREGRFDMTFIDTQHQPVDEGRLAGFCGMCDRLHAPALLRIRHAREAYLIGRYLDFGPLGIVIPQVETPETVREAIDAFYFPPLGRRSWGGTGAFRFSGFTGFGYAEWWNAHGLLMIQLESVNAVLNVRRFVQPGLDVVTFGGKDLALDMQTAIHSPFASFGDCLRYVKENVAGLPVKVGENNSPLGIL